MKKFYFKQDNFDVFTSFCGCVSVLFFTLKVTGIINYCYFFGLIPLLIIGILNIFFACCRIWKNINEIEQNINEKN